MPRAAGVEKVDLPVSPSQTGDNSRQAEGHGGEDGDVPLVLRGLRRRFVGRKDVPPECDALEWATGLRLLSTGVVVAGLGGSRLRSPP